MAFALFQRNSIPGSITAEEIWPESEYSGSKDNVCHRNQDFKSSGIECIKAVVIDLDSVR